MKNVFILLITLTCFIGIHSQGTFFSKEEESQVKLNGDIKFFTEYNTDYDKLEDSGVYGASEMSFNLTWEGEAVEAASKIKIDAANNNFTPFLDSGYIRFLGDSYDVEAGFLKPIWGTGDGIHVLDVLTPIDQVKNLTETYLESKVAQLMVKFNYQIGLDGSLELVYIPMFNSDLYPDESSDRWAPNEVKSLESILLSNGANRMKGDTDNIDNSQFAVRITNTFGSIDLGAVYYFGFLRKPIYDFTSPELIDGELYIEEKFNRVNIFGVDFAATVNSLYLRGEAAYYLTEDIDGDDSGIYNNSINYLFGFDYDLPLNNMVLITQYMGSYTLNNNKVENSHMEYREDDKYYTNMLTVELSDKYLYDTLLIKTSAAINLNEGDFMLTPNIEYNPVDDVTVGIKYQIFNGDEDTMFGQFDDNDYLKLYIKYNL